MRNFSLAKKNDLDAVQKRRIDAVFAKIRKDNTFSNKELFLSESVANSIEEKKAFLPSYDRDRILALLPFWKYVYVHLCPVCVSERSADDVIALVEAGAIIPVLGGPYAAFNERLRKVISSHDHVSRYEFSLYRMLMLTRDATRGLCPHCVERHSQEIHELVRASPKLSPMDRDVDIAIRNLHPFVSPDSDLIDQLLDASKRKQSGRFRNLVRLTWAIRDARSMQALNAPLLLNDRYLDQIPEGFAPEADEARALVANIQTQASNGLGLRIPTDVPIAQYVEIAKDFRPQIQLITKKLLETENRGQRDAAHGALLKRVMKLNAEVDRIKGLKRYALLEAALDFFGQNRALAKTSLIAGALGITSGPVACIAGAAVVAGHQLAKHKGLVKPSRSAERLAQLVRRDLQPYLNKLIAAYVGSDVSAVTLLSLRRQVSNRSSESSKSTTARIAR